MDGIVFHQGAKCFSNTQPLEDSAAKMSKAENLWKEHSERVALRLVSWTSGKLDVWIVDETCCSVKWGEGKVIDSYRSQAFTESCSIEEMFKEPNLGDCIRSQHLFEKWTWHSFLWSWKSQIEIYEEVKLIWICLAPFASICQLPPIVLWWKPISAD